ncbi:SOS response-associated peptidase [Vibrio maritimus]|uniref:SOS response-associated peptidase n=1 Tax=Vibrio maritimus TaxID=990268 RepID=UPI001F2C7D1B|nr:SOS response-associated peptidase family protein [Vibrio maritimus]
MCGRLNIIDDPFSQYVSEQLGLEFSTSQKTELFPSEQIDCIVSSTEQKLFTLPLSWGIKPSWSKRLIINAQAESVVTKPTFSDAYAYHRVIVPCSGWYEWKQNELSEKTKYLFSAESHRPLYMAAVGYPQTQQVVTLTTKPTKHYSRYHHRMPLMLTPQAAMQWLVPSIDRHDEILNSLVSDELWQVAKVG